MKLGSKSENLKKLEGKLRHAKVLPQFSLNAQDWNRDRERIFLDRELPDWISGRLIARSSASGEDSADSSMAGHFCSVLNIEGQAELENAIDEVVASFKKGTAGDQVFIQPMLSDVMISGVAFTRNPSNGSDFYVLNYDESSGSTESVTAGTSNDLRVYYHARSSENLPEGWLGSTLKLLQELEERFQTDALDVEFAVNTAGQLYLFQVRPLVMRVEQALTNDEYSFMLFRMAKKVRALAKPHPYLLGKRSIFGVMPDWNPAEILGTRPRPLALSLYKELITDNIWAYQRANYG